jgi:glycosyltransferase involved in cell wall biosynthesis
MRIVHIIPGSGDQFYCQNCMRDNSLVRVLNNLGHDSVTIPLYLPLSPDDRIQNKDIPVFYGAINIYLKQKFPLYRHVPLWLERAFDSRFMLNYAAKKSGSTQPNGLEDMTLSMLSGEAGNQSTELDYLIRWLKSEGRPDIVHLSNSLLLGMVKRLKAELEVPVVCTLQDENQWIEPMRENYRKAVWHLMAEQARYVDAFISVSQYYTEFMKKQLDLPDSKIYVIPIGICFDQYNVVSKLAHPPVVGYLSRLSESHGLGILIEAFIRLKQRSSFNNLRLHLNGGYTAEDKPYVKSQLRLLKKHSLHKDIQIFSNFDRLNRIVFLKNCTLLTVPVIHGEAFASYLLESLACGIPIVQPHVGSFTEIIEKTEGGFLYQPNTPDKLAETIVKMLSDLPKAQKMGLAGRKKIEKDFTIQEMVQKTIKVYLKVISDVKR